MSRPLSQIRPIPRRGLSREEAAMYVGVSPSTFDKLVADGRMPRPRTIGTRRLFDLNMLDRAFDELPIEGDSAATGWEDVANDQAAVSAVLSQRR